ncbi:hypothetical protein EVAR_14166_1 [Eumeta japonica]|uniref:Uncharacterized protein n=1 Tax=Eumeta variegata TaxID=151549 RepID=A0A4C1UEC6_EUMVA|nr:hypothetical protein EVAR_14166_1 [Eumeta japonica]
MAFSRGERASEPSESRRPSPPMNTRNLRGITTELPPLGRGLVGKMLEGGGTFRAATSSSWVPFEDLSFFFSGYRSLRAMSPVHCYSDLPILCSSIFSIMHTRGAGPRFPVRWVSRKDVIIV